MIIAVIPPEHSGGVTKKTKMNITLRALPEESLSLKKVK